MQSVDARAFDELEETVIYSTCVRKGFFANRLAASASRRLSIIAKANKLISEHNLECNGRLANRFTETG